MSTPIDFARKFPLFQAVGETEIEYLAAQLAVETHSQGATIFRQGDRGSRLYFLVSGRVEFLGQLSTGEEYLLEEVREGAIFGEVACFSQAVRTATARAQSDSILLVAEASALAEIASRCPSIGLALCSVMAKRLDRLSDQMHFTLPTVRQALASEATPMDRFTDRVVSCIGQYWAVSLQVILVITGVVLSIIGARLSRGDGALPPLWMDSNLWGLALGAIAMFIAALVLASERRQREDAEKRDKVWDDWRQDLEMKIVHIHQDVMTGKHK